MENTKARNVIIWVLVFLLILAIGYIIYSYVAKNQSADVDVTNKEKIDQGLVEAKVDQVVEKKMIKV